MRAIALDRTKKEVFVQTAEKYHTIVFYSPDMDFCVSLRLLFQDRYNMITITDPRMLQMTVREFKADLVIVDSLPTEKLKLQFEIMKRENPRVHILSFYASRFNDKRIHQFIRQSVDAAFSKPIDLAEVTQSIHELMGQNA
jgi:DNA-binding NarL/FixJ family response regulator